MNPNARTLIFEPLAKPILFKASWSNELKSAMVASLTALYSWTKEALERFAALEYGT